MGTISRDTPLAEITLRRYEKPTTEGRDLVRKLCLSVGLLQPGDSRDVIVDVKKNKSRNKAIDNLLPVFFICYSTHSLFNDFSNRLALICIEGTYEPLCFIP